MGINILTETIIAGFIIYVLSYFSAIIYLLALDKPSLTKSQLQLHKKATNYLIASILSFTYVAYIMLKHGNDETLLSYIPSIGMYSFVCIGTARSWVMDYLHIEKSRKLKKLKEAETTAKQKQMEEDDALEDQLLIETNSAPTEPTQPKTILEELKEMQEEKKKQSEG